MAMFLVYPRLSMFYAHPSLVVHVLDMHIVWLLSPAYEIGRGILKWRCPSVRPSVRPSLRPSFRPSVRHLRFLSN